MAQFDYFYPDGADQFTFYRIPKRFFTDNDLKTMSNGSKILYGLLLDRVDLSVKNRWMDDHRRIYVVYTLESIMQAMNVTDKPATKMLVELEKRGLIERKKPGLGRPTRLYVKNFSSKEASPEILRLQTRRNSDSGVGESTSQDSENLRPNHNNINDTEYNNTDHILSGSDAMGESHMSAIRSCGAPRDERRLMEQYFRESLGVEELKSRFPYDQETIEGMVSMLVDTCCSTRSLIRIAGDDKPAEVVRSQLMKLTGDHIAYVLSCLKDGHSDVRNIRQYLLGSLYNAPHTIDAYYTAQVGRDLYEGTNEFSKGGDPYIKCTDNSGL